MKFKRIINTQYFIPLFNFEMLDKLAYNVRGLLLWGIVAVSAPAQSLIKETIFYFKSKTV